jgi:hypothetical protein
MPRRVRLPVYGCGQHQGRVLAGLVAASCMGPCRVLLPKLYKSANQAPPAPATAKPTSAPVVRVWGAKRSRRAAAPRSVAGAALSAASRKGQASLVSAMKARPAARPAEVVDAVVDAAPELALAAEVAPPPRRRASIVAGIGARAKRLLGAISQSSFSGSTSFNRSQGDLHASVAPAGGLATLGRTSRRQDSFDGSPAAASGNRVPMSCAALTDAWSPPPASPPGAVGASAPEPAPRRESLMAGFAARARRMLGAISQSSFSGSTAWDRSQGNVHSSVVPAGGLATLGGARRQHSFDVDDDGGTPAGSGGRPGGLAIPALRVVPLADGSRGPASPAGGASGGGGCIRMGCVRVPSLPLPSIPPPPPRATFCLGGDKGRHAAARGGVLGCTPPSRCHALEEGSGQRETTRVALCVDARVRAHLFVAGALPDGLDDEVDALISSADLAGPHVPSSVPDLPPLLPQATVAPAAPGFPSVNAASPCFSPSFSPCFSPTTDDGCAVHRTLSTAVLAGADFSPVSLARKGASRASGSAMDASDGGQSPASAEAAQLRSPAGSVWSALEGDGSPRTPASAGGRALPPLHLRGSHRECRLPGYPQSPSHAHTCSPFLTPMSARDRPCFPRCLCGILPCTRMLAHTHTRARTRKGSGRGQSPPPPCLPLPCHSVVGWQLFYVSPTPYALQATSPAWPRPPLRWAPPWPAPPQLQRRPEVTPRRRTAPGHPARQHRRLTPPRRPQLCHPPRLSVACGRKGGRGAAVRARGRGPGRASSPPDPGPAPVVIVVAARLRCCRQGLLRGGGAVSHRTFWTR